MAISPAAPLAGAPLSRRLADTHSSPVRELLEIAMRPDVSRSPAACRRRTRSTSRARRGVRRGHVRAGARPRAAVLDEPRATSRYASGWRRSCPRAGCPSTADELLITTGSQQALGLVATALLDRATRPRRGPHVPGGAAGVPARRLSARSRSRATSDGPPGGADRDAAPKGAKVAYLIPTFQNPTGRTIGRRAPRGARQGRRRRRRCGWSRTTRTARSGWRASTSTCSPAVRRAGPHGRRPDALEGALARPADRTAGAAALHGPLAVAKQAADLHTSTVAQMAAAAWLETHDRARHIAGLAAHYRPRRDALLERPARSTCRPARCLTGARGRPALGRRCPTATTRRRSWPRAIERGVAFVPGLLLLRGRAVCARRCG